MDCKTVNLLQYLRNCIEFPSYAFMQKENAFKNLSKSLTKYRKRHKNAMAFSCHAAVRVIVFGFPYPNLDFICGTDKSTSDVISIIPSATL